MERLEMMEQELRDTLAKARAALDKSEAEGLKDDERKKYLDEYETLMAVHDDLDERAKKYDKLERKQKEQEARDQAHERAQPRGSDIDAVPEREKRDGHWTLDRFMHRRSIAKSIVDGERSLRTLSNDELELYNERSPEEIAYWTMMTRGEHRVSDKVRDMAMRTNVLPQVGTTPQSVGTDSAGGYTVPTITVAELIRSMAYYGPMVNSSVVRIRTTPTGAPEEWPSLDDTTQKGKLIAENTAAGVQNLTFGKIDLPVYRYSSDIIAASNELQQDTVLQLEREIVDACSRRIGRILNEHFTKANGSSKPTGIAHALQAVAARKQAITANTGYSFDDFVNLWGKVDPAYSQFAPGVGFQTHHQSIVTMRKVKDTQGQYIWQMGDVRTATPQSLWGYPVWLNNELDTALNSASNELAIFGDHRKYIVRIARAMYLQRFAELFAAAGQVGYAMFGRFGGTLMDNKALSVLVGK